MASATVHNEDSDVELDIDFKKENAKFERMIGVLSGAVKSLEAQHQEMGKINASFKQLASRFDTIQQLAEIDTVKDMFKNIQIQQDENRKHLTKFISCAVLDRMGELDKPETVKNIAEKTGQANVDIAAIRKKYRFFLRTMWPQQHMLNTMEEPSEGTQAMVERIQAEVEAMERGEDTTPADYDQSKWRSILKDLQTNKFDMVELALLARILS